MHLLKDSRNLSSDGVVYWTPNRYDKNRNIYFFSDPPHLIKTIRNNLENSGGHKNTRNLILNGKVLSWLQIIDLYNIDVGSNHLVPGLRKLHRLTYEHIYLNPSLRMRVNLAAQVISKSVADRLSQMKQEHIQELEKFIRLTDSFFDMLNVQNTFQGQKSRKLELAPYYKADDWRFEWLKGNYLSYINNWKKQVDEIEGIPNDMKARQCLSLQTIEGIRLTVHSFVEMVPMLLNKWKDHQIYFLSDKLNQDIVEEHFGRIRKRGGANENPTAMDYGLMNRKILVVKSNLLKVFRGNTRGRCRNIPEIDIDDETRLPKRQKKT